MGGWTGHLYIGGCRLVSCKASLQIELEVKEIGYGDVYFNCSPMDFSSLISFLRASTCEGVASTSASPSSQ